MTFLRTAAQRKALAALAIAHALFGLLLGMPLAWLLRDAEGMFPRGPRALFDDGSRFAVELFFKGELPLTTAASLVALSASILFVLDVTLLSRFLRTLGPQDGAAPKTWRTLSGVAGARVVFGVLTVGVVVGLGYLTTYLSGRGASLSDPKRDLFALCGYALGLLVALPVVLLRDACSTVFALDARGFLAQLGHAVRIVRTRFLVLAANYLARAVLAALLLGVSYFFVRATQGVLAGAALLLLSRTVVLLRTVVRASFYVHIAARPDFDEAG